MKTSVASSDVLGILDKHVVTVLLDPNLLHLNVLESAMRYELDILCCYQIYTAFSLETFCTPPSLVFRRTNLKILMFRCQNEKI
jgi:hypothetical protein